MAARETLPPDAALGFDQVSDPQLALIAPEPPGEEERALRDRGIPTEFVRYRRGRHSLQKHDHQREEIEGPIAWFEQHGK